MKLTRSCGLRLQCVPHGKALQPWHRSVLEHSSAERCQLEFACLSVAVYASMAHMAFGQMACVPNQQ